MKTSVGFLVLMLTVAPFCAAAELTLVIPKPRAQQVLVASAEEK